MSALLALLQVAGQGGGILSALVPTTASGQAAGIPGMDFSEAFNQTLQDARAQLQVRAEHTQDSKLHDELLQALLSGDGQAVAAIFAAHPELNSLKDMVLQWQQLNTAQSADTDTDENPLATLTDTADEDGDTTDLSWLLPLTPEQARIVRQEPLTAEYNVKGEIIVPPPAATAPQPAAAPESAVASPAAPVITAPAPQPIAVAPATPEAATSNKPDSYVATQPATAAIPAAALAPQLAPSPKPGLRDADTATPPLSMGQMISQAAKEMHQKTQAAAKNNNQTSSDSAADTTTAATDKKILPTAILPVAGQTFQDMLGTTEITPADTTGLTPIGALTGKGQGDAPLAKLPDMPPATAQLLAKAEPTEQVHIHIRHALEQGADRIRVNLHPAELGRVEIRMELSHDGTIKLHVSAERQETLDMLQRDGRDLAKSLQQAGLKADASGMQFSLRDESQSAWQQFSDQRSGNGQHPANDSDDPLIDGVSGKNISLASAYGLDIKI